MKPISLGAGDAPTLRSYQRRAVRDVERTFVRSRSVLLVEFMGAGKTVEAAEIVRRFVARGERVLVLAHRGEILKQTYRKLLMACIAASDIGFIWPHGEMNAGAKVQIASVQTLVRRGYIEGVGLVVVDEAHHVQAASWRKILKQYQNAKVLGLTATPERLDGKPLREFFEEMVLGEPCDSLIEAGWLTRPEIWTRKDGWYPKGLKKSSKRRGGDYPAKSAAKSMSGSTIIGGIPRQYLKRARGLPSVGFAATKRQALRLVAACILVGISSEPLFDSHTEKERAAILNRLSIGATKIVWTCDILGEGWDYPGARCVILARPTASLARYMQWCGRGMRPGPRAVILDHAGNYRTHGPPWEERDWSLDGSPKETMDVAVVDTDGRVSFLEPREVRGRLVRADHIERQVVCVGWKMACPTQEKPTKWAFIQKEIRKRKGDAWRCQSCAARKGHAKFTPEERRDKMRAVSSAMSPEARSVQAVSVFGQMKPELREIAMCRRRDAGGRFMKGN